MSTHRNHFFRLLCFALLLLTTTALRAQNRITGKIISAGDNQPIVGATVQEKGTTNATQTDNNGAFAINAPGNATLVISVVGYASQEVLVSNKTDISVSLQSTLGGMAEVVVIGYGVQRRTNVTGAISSVNSKTISELPVASVSQALQGRVPGLQVTNNGSPGTQPIVRIRGISSITFASDPLYVVDGFPTGNLSSIDTRDIETVDVLKDAAAAAIYDQGLQTVLLSSLLKKEGEMARCM